MTRSRPVRFLLLRVPSMYPYPKEIFTVPSSYKTNFFSTVIVLQTRHNGILRITMPPVLNMEKRASADSVFLETCNPSYADDLGVSQERRWTGNFVQCHRNQYLISVPFAPPPHLRHHLSIRSNHDITWIPTRVVDDNCNKGSKGLQLVR
jgi:hypothetical protein